VVARAVFALTGEILAAVNGAPSCNLLYQLAASFSVFPPIYLQSFDARSTIYIRRYLFNDILVKVLLYLCSLSLFRSKI
jgi:hypothetical protein